MKAIRKKTKKLICQRCSHDWVPRVAEPRQCPRCQVWLDETLPEVILLSQEG